ncbi:hypothetical protein OIY81_1103 [Cryptosporidium canis]|uniref:Uncharacterized protein n=1 Tax=Cryptosporidium canis TaxID=195482 RepID=A0ABQ8PBU6_9CRYT|nr:hypothetical protein OIY81_1103 [Cryptosporidium canis]KAJ1615320.1 hypothetical protein OJ252_235 [Cryptosporidium canis]
MAEFLLRKVREAFGVGVTCCSKCVIHGEKETLQCYDLDPPQIVNEIARLNNKGAVIGSDCNQREHGEDLARDAMRKVFGAALEKPVLHTETEKRSTEEEIDIPKLDLMKSSVHRTIKFEDCN